MARDANGAGRAHRALVLAGMLHAREADAAEDDTDLAKKTQNPVADLISVPFQSNFNFNTGSKDATVYLRAAANEGTNLAMVVRPFRTTAITVLCASVGPPVSRPSWNRTKMSQS